MPLPRFSKLDPAKRSEIIRVATEEFVERGYEKASLNRIVARSGMSKGAVYYYFADKDDLYRTILKTYSDKLLEIWSGGSSKEVPSFSGIRTPEHYWTEWMRQWQRSLSHHEQSPLDARLFGQCIRQRATGSSHPALGEIAAEMREWVREVLRRGQRIGAVRTDLAEDLLLETSFGMMEGFDRWVDRIREKGSAWPIDELAGLAVEFLRRMVEPSPEAPLRPESRGGRKEP